MAKVLADMLLVFGNLRFMTFLVIFSGFWAMFWHVFYALPFYVRDFLKFERFEIIETVDALTIIVVTVPATALAKRLKPLSAMVLGFVLATACWFVMGSVPTIAGTVVAIMLFALGEAHPVARATTSTWRTSPRRSRSAPTWASPSCRSRSAPSSPAGRAATWSSTTSRAATRNAPQMWLVVGAYGVVSTILMVLYDRFVAPKRAGGLTRPRWTTATSPPSC